MIKFLGMKIKQLIGNNSTVVKNFSYLTVMQLFTLLSPLITYPYLLRVIGRELYGSIVFAQTIITYINIFINFGFNLSGTQIISLNRNNPEYISEAVSNIYTSKFIFWLTSIIIYFSVVSFIHIPSESKLLYYISFFLTLNDLMLPIWYYQGVEKMKYITFLNIGVRILFMALIFVFVKDQSDFLLVPFFHSIGAICAGIASLYIIFKVERVKYQRPTLGSLKKYIVGSFPLFITSVSQSIYVNINKLVVGIVLGMSELAIYDFGEKITTFLKVPVNMIYQATFPKISRDRSIRYVNRLMGLSVAIITFIYALIFVMAPYIVYLFWGEIIQQAVTILRIIPAGAVFCCISTFLSGNRLMAWGFKKEYMLVAISSSIIYIILLFVFLMFGLLDIYMLAFLAVIGEIITITIGLLVNIRKKLIFNR